MLVLPGQFGLKEKQGDDTRLTSILMQFRPMSDGNNRIRLYITEILLF